MKKIVLLLLIVAAAGHKEIRAADKLVFDSTNNYLGACQLTDKSEWELKQDLNVTTFQVWYRWNQGESTLPVTVYYEGKEFAKFEAVRASCDPYQQQWCNADFAINKLLTAGRYSTQIPNARQCLKPGGTGAIRLYEAENITSSPTPTDIPPTVTEEKPTGSQPTVIETKPIAPATTTSCSCTQSVVVKSVLASAVTSLILVVLLKRLG